MWFLQLLTVLIAGDRIHMCASFMRVHFLRQHQFWKLKDLYSFHFKTRRNSLLLFMNQTAYLFTILPNKSTCIYYILYISQRQLSCKMKWRLVIIQCAAYIFWQLFLSKKHRFLTHAGPKAFGPIGRIMTRQTCLPVLTCVKFWTNNAGIFLYNSKLL